MRPLGKEYAAAKAMTGDFKKLPAGGYIAKITAVENKEDKSYLNVTFDIAMGEFKGFYADEWGKAHPYAHTFVRSYKEKALGMFKGFLKAVDESNGTDFETRAENGFPEQELVGKTLGVVFGYEEYAANDGNIKERLYVKSCMSADRIREGDFKVPDFKRLKTKPSASPIPEGFTALTDSDLPF